MPESVREVSKACESLCRWVQAVHEYCSMQHHLLVEQQLKVQAGEARRELHLLKLQEKEANRCLEDNELQLQNIRNEQMVLQRQLYKAEDHEEEATACAMQVEMHFQNWMTALQVRLFLTLNSSTQFLLIICTAMKEDLSPCRLFSCKMLFDRLSLSFSLILVLIKLPCGW